MDDPQPSDPSSTEPNPFSSPTENIDLPPPDLKPISPILIAALLMASLAIGCCTFFCTCLGLILVDPTGSWLMPITIAVSLVATVGSFAGILYLMRRKRQRIARMK